MNLSVSMGRSMTVIGFAILLMVLLSACSKKKAVPEDGSVGIFEISLPDKEHPNLRDYTADDLGEGVFEVTKLGFRVEPWPPQHGFSYSAQLIHTLAVAGQVSPSQDEIQSTYVGDPADIEMSFILSERVELRSYPVRAERYFYKAEIGPDYASVVEDIYANPHLISEYLKGDFRKSRGVYEYLAEKTSLYVIKTAVGFSVYFVIYDTGARSIGRIDYLKVGQ
jgi:hypothetical protein